MSHIKTVKKGKGTYYEFWDNGKLIKYIGNATKLRIFERDMQIGKEAAESLNKMPYLDPKSCLSIIAAAKKSLSREIPLPVKKYRTIVIDPPWPMGKILRDSRPLQTDFDYPVMDTFEISMLPIESLSNPDGCHIYLWTTQKFLPSALEDLKNWGVEYQCIMTWVKNVGFTPFSWMYSTEHCLFGHIGSLPLLRMGLRLDFEAKVREHSRKPEVFYDLVREASPGPRLDMFSREQHAGFDQYGNEVDKFGIR
ncbi:MAG: MT-A70 family methyltransferase [Dehalococcoidales bacterium]